MEIHDQMIAINGLDDENSSMYPNEAQNGQLIASGDDFNRKLQCLAGEAFGNGDGEEDVMSPHQEEENAALDAKNVSPFLASTTIRQAPLSGITPIDNDAEELVRPPQTQDLNGTPVQMVQLQTEYGLISVPSTSIPHFHKQDQMIRMQAPPAAQAIAPGNGPIQGVRVQQKPKPPSISSSVVQQTGAATSIWDAANQTPRSAPVANVAVNECLDQQGIGAVTNQMMYRGQGMRGQQHSNPATIVNSNVLQPDGDIQNRRNGPMSNVTADGGHDGRVQYMPKPATVVSSSVVQQSGGAQKVENVPDVTIDNESSTQRDIGACSTQSLHGGHDVHVQQNSKPANVFNIIRQDDTEAVNQYGANPIGRSVSAANVTSAFAQYTVGAVSTQPPPTSNVEVYSTVQHDSMASNAATTLATVPQPPQTNIANGAFTTATRPLVTAAYGQRNEPHQAATSVSLPKSIAPLAASESDWLPKSSECSIPGCTIRRGDGTNLYQMPKIYKKAKYAMSMACNAAWLAALKRGPLTEVQRRLVRVCGLHFVKGKIQIDIDPWKT